MLERKDLDVAAASFSTHFFPLQAFGHRYVITSYRRMLLNIMNDRPPVRLVNDDAVNCFKHIESDKIIIYAYNPFDGSILRSALEALDPSICVLFIYVEPAHCDILVDLGFICVFDKRILS